jgi:undecaprenyl diphosphate synthase
MADPSFDPTGPVPRHVAIIMDGNGRWAQGRGLPRVEGHREGARAVNRTVTACRELGVEYLTLYAFSEQNWARPDDEVGALMQLLSEYVHDERSQILDNRIRLTAIGDLDRLPDYVRGPLRALAQESADNSGMTLALALSYGGREELVRATQQVARRVAAGELKPDDICAADLDAGLYTAGWPSPDLLIRTSGELRLSNFLLWQCAYAELFFTPIAWPEFQRHHLEEAFAQFARRQRRFGLTGEQLDPEDCPDANPTPANPKQRSAS